MVFVSIICYRRYVNIVVIFSYNFPLFSLKNGAILLLINLGFSFINCSIRNSLENKNKTSLTIDRVLRSCEGSDLLGKCNIFWKTVLPKIKILQSRIYSEIMNYFVQYMLLTAHISMMYSKIIYFL